MYFLFILFLAVLPPFTPPPASTPEIEEIIRKLGHNEWIEREKAEAALVELDMKAYTAIKQHAAKDQDAEVRARCRFLLNKVLKDIRSNISVAPPKIWDLSNEIRFPNGIGEGKRDIAREYYETGWKIVYPEALAVEYDNQDIARASTMEMIADYRGAGLSKHDAIELLDDMVMNGVRFFHVRYCTCDCITGTLGCYKVPSELIDKEIIECEYEEFYYDGWP